MSNLETVCVRSNKCKHVFDEHYGCEICGLTEEEAMEESQEIQDEVDKFVDFVHKQHKISKNGKMNL